VKIQSISFRLATEDDAHLDTYDNTKLTAYNTCPTWGVTRYGMHKTMSGDGRVLPLEMGSAMHEFFAWVRLVTLAQQQPNQEMADAILSCHGARLFGVGRLELITDGSLVLPEHNALPHWLEHTSFNVLDSSGYYDDPRDKRRTLSNMQEAALAYLQKWDRHHRVWMRDETDPTSDVGIEIPFDLVVDAWVDEHPGPYTFRYTGKIDGIHWHRQYSDKLYLGENKTASRLNDAWAMSFVLASQVTGYCVAASVFTGESVRNAFVHGLMIPLPKSYDYGGIITETVSRRDHHIEKWVQWMIETVLGYRKYENNPHDAPQFTHSCNRYFRPCSMIPFCDSEREEQKIMLDGMRVDEWSPLHKEVQE
jgi:hypothetical protein